MAGWYVRRGEKVLGPISSTQLKEGYAAGKLLITDEIAKDPGGPWTEVRKTSLAPHAETRPAIIPVDDQAARIRAFNEAVQETTVGVPQFVTTQTVRDG
jgi:hypothetical protein